MKTILKIQSNKIKIEYQVIGIKWHFYTNHLISYFTINAHFISLDLNSIKGQN